MTPEELLKYHEGADPEVMSFVSQALNLGGNPDEIHSIITTKRLPPALSVKYQDDPYRTAQIEEGRVKNIPDPAIQRMIDVDVETQRKEETDRAIHQISTIHKDVPREFIEKAINYGGKPEEILGFLNVQKSKKFVETAARTDPEFTPFYQYEKSFGKTDEQIGADYLSRKEKEEEERKQSIAKGEGFALAEEKRRQKNREDKEALLADPLKINSMAARYVQQFMPKEEKEGVKVTKEGALRETVAEVEEKFNEKDPMRNYATSLITSFTEALESPEHDDLDPAQLFNLVSDAVKF